jgi:hypothetical protein
MKLISLIFTAFALGATAAHAQVAPPAMRILSDMSGFKALQASLGAPLRPPAPGTATVALAPASLAFGRSAGGARNAMSEATQLLTKTGVSAEVASRLTHSGYFSNAAKRYGAGLGLNPHGNLADALATYLAICRGSIKATPTTKAQADGLQVLAQSRLLQHLNSKGAVDVQAAAEALNVQTGLAALVTDQRKASGANLTELSIYCTEGTRKLGFDVEQINLGS